MFKKIYFALIFRITKWSFNFWQAIGLHITPNHFYQPVPDTRYLPKSLWEGRSGMIGVEFNEIQQLSILEEFNNDYKVEYEQFPQKKTSSSPSYQYYSDNPFFGPVDAEILYCMIRKFKPRRIYEIGSGFTTYLSAQAVVTNEKVDGYISKLIAIEPYPNAVLKQGFPGLSDLKITKLQDIPLDFFSDLTEGDILFIDSSHILTIGSDVAYEFLEILPRLNKGVIVHIHDIYLPYEYPQNMIFEEKKFYNEQYLLHAFLINNHIFEVMFSGYFMHRNHSVTLEKVIPSYKPDSHQKPVSFWIRRK